MSQAIPLTKGDVLALRGADTICFDHNKGVSYIRAILRESDTVPFEQTRKVYCDMILTDYAARKIAKDTMACYVYMSSSQYDHELQTILGLLKVGDCLTLHWQRGALNSEVVKSVDFVGDKLSLIIQRGEKRLTFHIDQQLGPDNTARMIKGPHAAEYSI